MKYFDKAFPVDPQTIPLIFASAADPRQPRSSAPIPQWWSCIRLFRVLASFPPTMRLILIEYPAGNAKFRPYWINCTA